MKKSTLRGLTSATAMVAAIVMGGSIAAVNNAPVINEKLGFATNKMVLKPGVTDTNGDGVVNEQDVPKPQYFLSNFAKDVNNVTAEEKDAKNAAVAAFVETEAEEGAVLLTNKNNALPLQKGAKVSLFGRATVNAYYKGNSGGGSGGTKVTYLDAMQDPDRAAFQVNQTLVDAYSNDKSPLRSATTRTIGESPVSVYTDDVKASFAGYGDAAIVILAREGAESNDLYTHDSEGISELALHKDERDMLEIVKSYKQDGTFKKIIVLINSGHPMEVKWLDEYDVDACMVIGGPGQSTGFRGVSDLLVGNANPSGRLVDTYASNSLSAPATQNFGEYRYENHAEVASICTDNANDSVYYVVQTEGIYVGYRYYETRYEDAILGRYGADSNVGTFDSKGAWNYAEEMSFPFGYGISYTTFEQTLTGVTRGEKTTTVKGTVKNTGSVPGKSVVEIYAQTPYGDYEVKNKVEKSAVQLVGFTKTAEIPAGQTVNFEVTFDNYMLASYDYTNAKTYILSQGDYYLALGDDAHDALNNILAAKGKTGLVDHNGNAVTGDKSKTYTWKQANLDTTTYKYSENGTEITNQMQEADLNYYQDGLCTYLTRSDWAGTFPVKATVVNAPMSLINKLSEDTYKKPADAPSAFSAKLGVQSGLTLADMWGVEYNDPLWNQFIDQMSLSELILATMDQGGIGATQSIAAPKSGNGDGPDGIASNAYVNESLAAATWSKEMLAKRGDFMGEDALLQKRPQEVWCPGNDTHRTPFGGRNFEYYSEDPTLAYELTAAECAALEAKGVSAGPKHFFANDQETWRTGVSTFANEQEYREIQLRAFEGAFTKGGATSVMTSFNRIGPVWIGHFSKIQDNILRGEWGFNGFVITDAAGTNSYMHTVQALANGTDMFCYTSGNARDNRIKEINRQVTNEDDGNLVNILKEISHRIFYTYAHSNMMNGLSSVYDVVPITPTWVYIVYGVNAVAWIIPLLLCILYALKSNSKKRRTNDENA